MSAGERALVAGIGNPDRGDDGIGPAVARRLTRRPLSAVHVIECRGDVLSLIEEWQEFAVVVIVDAAAPAGRPGRVHRLDLSQQPLPDGFTRSSTHALGLGETVELARRLGRLPRRVVAYLVEGERFDIGAPMSAAVVAAGRRVAKAILSALPELTMPAVARNA